MALCYTFNFLIMFMFKAFSKDAQWLQETSKTARTTLTSLEQRLKQAKTNMIKEGVRVP